MNNPSFSPHSTSADLEQEILSRFRQLVTIIPKNCKIFREISDCSPVLCFDFIDCPEHLDSVKEQSLLLSTITHNLGLAKTLIFRLNRAMIGWQSVLSDE